MPNDPTEPVTESCCQTVRDLMVRGVRTGDTSRDTATRVLTALGYEVADVEELVHAAEEAGA